MTGRARLRTHAFHASGHTDGAGVPICHCGSLKTAAVHHLGDRTDEQRAAEARRIGDT